MALLDRVQPPPTAPAHHLERRQRFRIGSRRTPEPHRDPDESDAEHGEPAGDQLDAPRTGRVVDRRLRRMHHGGSVGGDNRNFGPNKPPKGRGGSNFAKNRNQEGKARGPLKERLSGRMFSVEEDARFRDEDDTGIEELDLALKEEDVVKEEEVKEDDE